MNIEGAVVLVTGANRGIGAALVRELHDRGAAKIYAASRTPIRSTSSRIAALRLDITDPAQVAAAAAAAPDVTLLINNAGLSTFAPLVTGSIDDVRQEMETNYFGTLSMVREFAPVLAANGGGAILNVLSVMAWIGMAQSGGYTASKAAAWGLTNAVRVELAGQGTQVSGLIMASTDTDMVASFDVPKNDPADIARIALDGVEAGVAEVVADTDSVTAKALLSTR